MDPRLTRDSLDAGVVYIESIAGVGMKNMGSSKNSKELMTAVTVGVFPILTRISCPMQCSVNGVSQVFE